MLAPTILPVSTGSTDIILVYLTQTIANMRKAQPKPTREMARAVILLGLSESSVIAPMERASPKIRSERV